MSKYGFNTMAVGKVLTFTDASIHTKVVASARKFFKKNDWNLAVYSMSDGVLRIRRDLGGYHSCKTGRKRGTPPGPPWKKLVSFTADGVTSWSLYWKRRQPGWKIFKLVADGMADDKANYYINAILFREDDDRVVFFSDDYDELAEKRPELCKVVKGYIERNIKATEFRI